MNLIVVTRAQNDIQVATNWYEEQLPGLGIRFLRHLNAAVQKITDHPFQYRLVNAEVRVCLLQKFPYKIFYSILNQELVILRIRHHKQKTLRRFR